MKRKKKPEMTLEQVLNTPMDKAVRQVLSEITATQIKSLVEWSLEIAKAATAKGWDGQGEQSIPEWIRQNVGVVVQ